MNKLWRTCADKIDAWSLRERAMVFIAVVAAVLYMANTLFIDPALTRQKALSAAITQQEAELQAMRLRIQALEKMQAAPDAANLARRGDVRRRLDEIDAQLKGIQSGLVPAQRMNALLQQVLARNPRLQLIALRTLPVTLLIEKSESAKANAAAGAPKALDKAQGGGRNVFKHGVQLTVQGSYADLYDYLVRLEKPSWRMYWSRASLNAADYPRLTLTITLYTLSLDRAWLEV